MSIVPGLEILSKYNLKKNYFYDYNIATLKGETWKYQNWQSWKKTWSFSTAW